jgi:hypothetical protein
MGNSDGTQLHAQPAHDSFAESVKICYFSFPGIKNKYCTNYLITGSRVLLEKPTVLQPVKKYPTFYGTSRFMTMFTHIHNLPVSLTI